MEGLDCRSVRRLLWDHASGDYKTGMIAQSERIAVDAHLDDCRECLLHRGEVRSLHSGLRHLPAMKVPPMLNTRLRVLASRDRSRRLVRRDFASWIAEMKSVAKLFFDNLLRPFALPAAGGILASTLCFGVVVDNIHLPQNWENDLPVGISTEVAVEEWSPFSYGSKDVLVQLTVDSQGHVTDYALPEAAHASPEELQEIGNLVLYSTFSPAMRLGQRVAGKRWFNLGHYSVKG
jgi:hypothetical protein